MAAVHGGTNQANIPILSHLSRTEGRIGSWKAFPRRCVRRKKLRTGAIEHVFSAFVQPSGSTFRGHWKDDNTPLSSGWHGGKPLTYR